MAAGPVRRRTRASAVHPRVARGRGQRAAGPPAPRALRALRLAGSAGVVASVAAFGGRLWWVLDLAANLRGHLALGLLAVGVALAAVRSWGWAALCAAGVAANLALVAPLLGGDRQGAAGAELTVVSFNLRAASRAQRGVTEQLRRTPADVVFLTEAYGDWPRHLRTAGLPFQVVQPGGDTGLVWLTRSPPLAAATGPGHPRVASRVTVEVHGRQVRLIGAHPVRPVGRDGALHRDRQLRAVADAVARDSPGPTVVVGDLNATRWSAGFAPLVRAGLRDSATGSGWQPTWPAGLGPLGVPIDHALHSPDLRVVSRAVPAWPGSDHRAVEVVLALPPSADRPRPAVRSAVAPRGGAYHAPRRVNPPPLARLGQGPPT